MKEAKALKQLLCEHPVFGGFGEENIINVAGNSSEDEEREDALKLVEARIGNKPELTATITISCGRLTTGVTVRPWTAVFYMKGSEMTSAATYMQTIFRVQSPYVVRDAQGNPIRMKQECYVFDFAPDRSLKMVAETAKFSSLAKKSDKKRADGEAMTQEERDKETMRDFLDLCPVVSLDDGQMVPYDEQKLFRQLERVFIDRLVTSGFNDNYLYNPEELMSIDSEELNELGKKIAQSSNMEKPKNATPNSALQLTPLTEEERLRLEEAKRKARENHREKRDPYEGLTPQEIAALEAEKERRKKAREERDKRITNLRGISLRIPLLMYGGADAGDPKEDLTVENFTRKIKDESWEEFMPRGITKKDFNAIRRCYNATRFEEAGKRYRALAREADSMHVEDRVRRIADIFGCFHNPDKETVLTPWRVVNMHMSDTLGGYCFFNEKFDGPCQKEVLDEHGNVIDIVQTTEPRYIDQGEVTKKVFEDSEAKILEINSKTGLYPLYVAYSLYRRRMKDFYDVGLIEEQSVEEEQVVWDDIIRNNIYVICNTPMAVRITQRTLFGFREDAEGKANIKSKSLIQEAITNPAELIQTIKSVGFWQGTTSKKQMEFKAIVGNPPYQLNDGGGGRGISATPIYQHFVNTAKMISPFYFSMIMPSRWYAGGRGLDDFRNEMLHDQRISNLFDFPKSRDCFENVDIAGGICYFLWDSIHKGDCNVVSSFNGQRTSNLRNLSEFNIFIRDNIGVGIVKKVIEKCDNFYSGRVFPNKPFGLRTYARVEKSKFENCLTLYSSEGKGYIKKEEVTKNADLINSYKVYIGLLDPDRAGVNNSEGRNVITKVKIIGPKEVITETYLMLDVFTTELQAYNCASYFRTKFARVLISLGTTALMYTKECFQFLPIEDYSRLWNDEDLYNKYDLDMFEREYIESMIKPME